MSDLLIENITIVTVNKEREILENHSLVVDGSKIKDIGPSEIIKEKYKDIKKKIDGRGKIIFPGLINTHNHLFQNLLKGLGDDLVLSDWLKRMTFPSAAHLSPKDTYDAAMLGCVDGIRSGTTTMLDYMYPHPVEGLSDGVINAFRELKIRGIFGRGMMNTGMEYGAHKAITQEINVIEKDCYRLFDKYHGAENDRIKIWMAPAAVS